MRIMFCVLCLSYGGAEKNLCIVANELAKRGHEIYICNLNYLPTIQHVDDDVTVIDAPRYTIKGIKRAQQLFFIMKQCKHIKPDLLASFLYIPNFLSPIAGKILNIPTIISERGDPSRRSGKLQYFYNWADGAVFQTEGAKSYFSGKLQDKSAVIPNPVIVKNETIRVDYSKRSHTIAYSARFSVEQKRQDLMLEAFKLVLKKHPEFILDFYGDGPDEEKMREYAQNLGISGNVRFNGLSLNIMEDLSRAELFVLSSEYEGIPNALIEAMSIGLPCVSTDCTPGGARLLIEDGINGQLVERNNPEQLSEAINLFIENREFAIQCGKNALEIKTKFCLSNIIDMWEQYCFTKVKGKNYDK